MKKFLSVILVVMMLASLSVSAFATASQGAVPPSQRRLNDVDVEENTVEIEGLEGVDTSTLVLQLIGPTSEPDANATEEEKAEFEANKKALNDAFAMLNDPDALAEILNGAVTFESSHERAVSVYDTSEDAVPSVGEYAYLVLKDKDGNSVLPKEYVEGEAPTVKVYVTKTAMPKNLIKVIQLVGDTWVEVPFVNNAKGKVVLEVSYAGPIFFIVNANAENG